MDFQALSRKELQTLCKAQGIPANRSNVFMAEALASKRIPLSEMDPNREQKSSLPGEMKRRDGDGAEVRQCAVKEEQNGDAVDNHKFKNNFLRRGTRVEASVPQKPAAVNLAAMSDALCRGDDRTASSSAPSAAATGSVLTGEDVESPYDKLKVSAPLMRKEDVGLVNDGKDDGRFLDRKMSKEDIFKAHPLQSERFEADTQTCRTDSHGNSTNSSIDGEKHLTRISESIRSQVDAALCSRVTQGALYRSQDRSVLMKMEGTGSEALSHPEALHPEIVTEDALAQPTPARHHTVDLDASPPLKFSPLLLLVDEKVRAALEKISRFWGRGVSSLSSSNSSSPDNN